MEAAIEQKKKLTLKQQKFIDVYLETYSATKAALAAGYSEKTARNIGSENLTKPDIHAEIERRRAELDAKVVITDDMIRSFWIEIMQDREQNASDRIRCAENLAKERGMFKAAEGQQLAIFQQFNNLDFHVLEEPQDIVVDGRSKLTRQFNKQLESRKSLETNK